MMTRKALARQEQIKLQLTLRELQASKERCDQLNREREGNELELLDVLNMNERLRDELAKLHSEYNNILDDRDKLQRTVDGFDACMNEYTQTLNHITSLKRQLFQAHSKISELESVEHNHIVQCNNSLFSELVGPVMNDAAVGNLHTSVIIDLTTEDEPVQFKKSNKSVKVIKCSRNKLKKYIKIKKYITKTKKFISKHKFFIDSMALNRQRLQLIDQVQMYSLELDNVSSQYVEDTRAMQLEIDRLRESIKTLTMKYEVTEKQSREQVLAIVVQGRYAHPSSLHRGITLVKVVATWDEARQHCAKDGAILASPLNTDLLSYMTSHIGVYNHSSTYFIDMKARNGPHLQFVSLEGTELDDLPEEVKDMIDQIDPRDGDCLSMDQNTIRAVSCWERLPFLCYTTRPGQQQAISTTTSTTTPLPIIVGPGVKVVEADSDSDSESQELNEDCGLFEGTPFNSVYKVWAGDRYNEYDCGFLRVGGVLDDLLCNSNTEPFLCEISR